MPLRAVASTSRTRIRRPTDILAQKDEALAKLESLLGQKLGDRKNPLLVSVRSGAKFSMPGMMDTVLNLGMNDEVVEVFAEKTNNPRFAYDSYRRFIQMFGNVVMEIPKEKFEHVFDGQKKKKKVKLDTELTAEDLKQVIAEYKKVVRKEAGKDFPQDPQVQLNMAIEAVFRSWYNPRAKTYRRLNKISDDLGTAVNVQTMVFGNMGDTSGTGVGFTRNPATGAKEFYGEFLMNAQGEDVVAGVRTPVPIKELEKIMPEVYNQLHEFTTRLEQHYKDVQDFEFTIQDGKLYMLQTRNGKRTGPAAVRIAVEMEHEGLLTSKEALLRVEPEQLNQLLHPVLDESQAVESAGHRVAGITGRRSRARGVHRRRCGGEREDPAGHPGARRDRPGRYPRHGSGGGYSHFPRWHDVSRRRGNARHGQALRGRLRRSGSGRKEQAAQDRQHRSQGRRLDFAGRIDGAGD